MTHLRLPKLWALAFSFAACGEDDTSSPAPTPTVDQEFAPGAANALVGIGTVGAWAQTFTVGTGGTLHSVDLILAAQGADDVVRIDIRGTTGGSPNLDDGAVLGSVLVTAPSLPTVPSTAFVTIDFSDREIPLIAGQVLSIVLIRVVGTGNADVLWIYENQAAEEYAGGTALQRNGGSGTGWTAFASDFYFRTNVLAP